jgi:hypothetical protein
LVLLHLPPLGGQDCNRLMLVTLWLLAEAEGDMTLAVVVVRVATNQEQHL